jgi:hypothetical protein
VSYKVQQTYLLILAHSWLPLRRKKLFGYFNLYARRRQIVSREFLPLLQKKNKYACQLLHITTGSGVSVHAVEACSRDEMHFH